MESSKVEQIVFSVEGAAHFTRMLEKRRAKTRSTTEEEFGGAAGAESSTYHDNFEYEEASRKLGDRSRKIRKEEEILAKGRVVEVRDQVRRAAVGSTVVLEYDDTDEIREITIGAYGESDPPKLISYLAPLAQAIIGREVGDEAPFRGRLMYIEELHPASYRYRKMVRELFERQMRELEETSL